MVAAVERERVDLLVLEPEVAGEPLAQRSRLALESRRAIRIAGAAEQSRDLGLRRVDVALDLDQRDRRLGERAVGVADRVPRVLPALVDQRPLARAGVFDVAVAVEV